MVNSPKETGALALRQRDDSRKTINVAASRARDQLWVVHSLDPGRDLKPGDLRHRLIAHAEDPSALRPKRNEEERITPILRDAFDGLLIANGGYTSAEGHEAIRTGAADAVSFGSLFLANPDLPRRFAL